MPSDPQTDSLDLNEVLLDTDPSTMALALELTDVGVFDYDPVAGRLRFSKRCKLLWGLALDEEPTLARLHQLLHPDDGVLIEHFRASLDPTGPGSFDVDQRIVRADGLVAWVRTRGRTLFGSEEEGRRALRCVGTMRDVTEQHRARDELVRSEARKAHLLQLSDALRPLTNPVEIQVTAAKVLCERLRASRVMYGEVEELDEDAFVVHRDYRRGEVPSAVGHHRFRDYGNHIVPALRAGRTLVVRDVRAIPECAGEAERAYQALGIRSCVLAPLVKGDRICSFLAVDQAIPRDWTDQEIALVQETAERTWAAVGHARAEAALRASDRRKDEFLATLAHELRNPLAPLRNGLQITRMKCPADPTLTRAVEMMDRQLSHLVRLVDDLLDVGRINTGKLELRRQPLRLSEVLASSIEAVRALLESRQHELLLDLGNDGRTVFGDFDRLTQVFINLLTNAAKYTEPGGRIRVSLVHAGSHEIVRIEDTGIGIAFGDLPKVFELFSQVRTGNGNGGSGLGIGLSLVRRLVELHGGTVQVESAGLGLGSAFTVRLPVMERAGRVPQQQQEPESDPVGAAHRRVLVIDDNVEAADSLASVLQLMGHETAVAYDGLEGLALAQEMRPDLVLLDLGMPQMDGLETARRMRALEILEGVRIVAVTGWGLESDRARTRAAGFDAHLVKPVDVSTLEEVLADFTHRAA